MWDWMVSLGPPLALGIFALARLARGGRLLRGGLGLRIWCDARGAARASRRATARG